MAHCPRRGVLVMLALAAAAAAPAALLAAGPQMTATFTVTDAKPSGDSMHLTFAFSLRTTQPGDLVVEAVKLGNPAASDHPYATFPGGTIRAGGELTGSQGVLVPKTMFKKWKGGQPAALFVRTAGDSGSAVWTRVDATASGPIQ